MAFGKRSGGDLPPAGTTAEDALAPNEALISAPGLGAVRTRVANHGETLDRKFIALAAGVVVFAASAAVAAPSFFSAITGGVRPIEQVVAGLDRQQARIALAAEAFPDADGHAFMTSLATSFPKEHGRLLDTLADTAMAGGDRDDLFETVNAWSMDFVPDHMSALGRTGARGFDAGMVVLEDTLQGLEAELGGCTGAKFQKITRDPAFLERLSHYDGRSYHITMRANRAFVDLAATGRTAPAISSTLTANDNSVLQATFISMLGDPQVSQLFQAFGSAQGNHFNAQDDLFYNVNFCQLGRTLLIKLKGLPDGTKGRLFSMAMSQDLRGLYAAGAFNGMGAFNGPTGNRPANVLPGVFSGR